MAEILQFADRAQFRDWLSSHWQAQTGVWLLFGKSGGPQTLKPDEALEEALCFGWIDGQMQSIDSTAYRKYFAPRRKESNWSEKNKTLALSLEKRGLMTEHGREKIEEAQRNGQWSAEKAPPISAQQIELMSALLQAYPQAYANFRAMSPSVQKTYTKAYLSAKTDTGRASRLQWMVARLEKNLNPM